MAEKKTNMLLVDIDEEASLIALYSSLEIFRMAYQINRVLNLNLAREERDIDFQSNNGISYYPLYHYFDEKTLLDFYLVANRSSAKPPQLISQGSLFSDDSTFNTYLISERKRVDYFFKIEGSEEAMPYIEKLKYIKRVSAVFPVSITGLKSYENLIFN